MPTAVFVPAKLNDLSVDVSLTSVARGDVLYRGSAKWNNLAAATVGMFLRTGGSGADPGWSNDGSNLTGLSATNISAGTLSAVRGGTGVSNNAASTLTISGNFGTTLTVSGTTSVTLPTSGILAILASPAFTGVPTVPTAAALTNTTQAASTAFVTSAVATAVVGTLKFQGATDCSGNPNYPVASKGDVYVVSVAGKIGGASGLAVDVGDEYFATADNAGGTQASVGTSWAILEHNLQGALLSANNLSDVALASTSRTNLGLGSAALLSDPITIGHGGTGQVTANAAFNALVPSQAAASGKYLTSNGTDTSWGTVSSPTAANPTASVGLTAINGSASTFLRSDGAPALDVTIAPTWTNAHIFLTAPAIRDTSAAFNVTIAATSSTTLTAGRTLTLDVGNVAHTLKLGTTANTITFPNAASDTVAMLGVANTFTANQTISKAIPILTLTDATGGGKQWQIRNGSVTQSVFDIYNATGSQTMFYMDTAEVRIGSAVNNGGVGNSSRLYVFGGANGANVDIQGDGTVSDQATMELEGSDYSTQFKSIRLQYNGVNGIGTTFGVSNVNLGSLIWQSVTAAIMGTSTAVPVRVFYNASESMRFGAGLMVGTTTDPGKGAISLSQAVNTTGSPTALTVTGGAHTTLAASTEAIDANFNLARTVQFATGALTTQRALVVQAPTYGFVGASTLTTAVTVDITSAPIAGTNATLTNAYGLRVSAGQTAAVPLVVKGSGSQSGNLQEWQNGSGIVLTKVTSAGGLVEPASPGSTVSITSAYTAAACALVFAGPPPL